jgi:hypothetical protein
MHALRTLASIMGLSLLALTTWVPSALADDGVVFESHASGTTAGGGVLIGTGRVYAQSSSGTLYAALYRIDNTHDTFDAAGNADLLATTVLSPGAIAADVSGPVSVTVPPGWYAVGVGIGRHGASAGNFGAFLPDLDNAEAANSYGPYAISTKYRLQLSLCRTLGLRQLGRHDHERNFPFRESLRGWRNHPRLPRRCVARLWQRRIAVRRHRAPADGRRLSAIVRNPGLQRIAGRHDPDR